MYPPAFFFYKFPLFAVFHAVRRWLNAAYPGFPDAMELIVGARLGFERLGVEQEVRPPVVSAVVLSLLRIRARV